MNPEFTFHTKFIRLTSHTTTSLCLLHFQNKQPNMKIRKSFFYTLLLALTFAILEMPYWSWQSVQMEYHVQTQRTQWSRVVRTWLELVATTPASNAAPAPWLWITWSLPFKVGTKFMNAWRLLDLLWECFLHLLLDFLSSAILVWTYFFLLISTATTYQQMVIKKVTPWVWLNFGCDRTVVHLECRG